MAYADYKHCELCDDKVFYDSSVEYEHNTGEHMALCKKCSLTHTIIVVEKLTYPNPI